MKFLGRLTLLAGLSLTVTAVAPASAQDAAGPGVRPR